MSASPTLRRKDKALSDAEVEAMLATGYCGRLGTIGVDGYPYCVPLLYVWLGGEVWLHNTAAEGHLKRNVLANSRVCFEIDEPGEVFPYGRFECDSSIAYRSVILFGRARIIEAREDKERFFAALMEKYAPQEIGRPKGFFPRLGQTTVYAVSVERVTGKQTPLPPPGERWPAADYSASPNARYEPPPDQQA